MSHSTWMSCYSTLSSRENETAWENAREDRSVAYWVVFCLYTDSAVSQHVRKPLSLPSSKSLRQEGPNKKNLLVNKTAAWKTLKSMPGVILSLKFKHRTISIISSFPKETVQFYPHPPAQRKGMCLLMSSFPGEIFLKRTVLLAWWAGELGRFVLCSNNTHFYQRKNESP